MKRDAILNESILIYEMSTYFSDVVVKFVAHWSNVCKSIAFPLITASGKSEPKDQVALHYYYTSPSHWCTTHEVSKF